MKNTPQQWTLLRINSIILRISIVGGITHEKLF